MKNFLVLSFTSFALPLRVFAVVAALSLPVATWAQDAGYGYTGPQAGQADPPSVVGRLSVLQGNVSVQPAGVQDFSAAELNYPLTAGDRLYSDSGARGEIEAGQLAIRLGARTDFTVTALSDQLEQFGLAQGSVHLRAYAFDPATTTEVDTPNASVTLLQPGDTRVDVYPQDSVTVVTVLSGQVQVNADGVQQVVQPGQSLEISGSGPARAQFVGRPRSDDLDRFSGQRDATYQRGLAAEGSYVNPATVGADDLADYGDWGNSDDYGPVWYPRGVAVDWCPYSVGHWASIAPWGWTWVGGEPWGFAPYHYGRWAQFGGRWGWVPGPAVVRPVYSPALVVFVGGGSGFSRGGLSIGIGGGGVAAWFPLGPREAYHPWYRSSPAYVNRVNVTNIYNRNTVEVRNIYNNRTTNVYANVSTANYANRAVATVAIPQRNFGSARPVRESAIHVDPRQFQNAPVLSRPPVEPQQAVAARPPARAVPAQVARPMLATRANGNPGGSPAARSGVNGNGAAPGAFGGHPVPQSNPAAGQPNRGNNPQPAAIVRPGNPPPAQAVPQQPVPSSSTSNGQVDSARPGPRRQAPDAPIHVEAQPGNQQPAYQQRPQQQPAAVVPPRPEPPVGRPIVEHPAMNQTAPQQPRPQPQAEPAPRGFERPQQAAPPPQQRPQTQPAPAPQQRAQPQAARPQPQQAAPKEQPHPQPVTPPDDKKK